MISVSQEHRQLQATSLQHGRTPSLLLEWSVVLIAVSAICVTPWLFGGVEPVTQWWLGLIYSVACLLAVAHTALDSRTSIKLPKIAFALFAGLGLAWLQVLPMHSGTIAQLTPFSDSIRNQLAIGDDGFSEDTPTDSEELTGNRENNSSMQTMSLAPFRTRTDASLLWLGIASFFLGVYFLSRRDFPLIVLFSLATVGVGLVIFGVVQKYTWNGRLYWTVELTQGGHPFGPYVNRNNAGGFLCLCLAAALGGMRWRILKARQWKGLFGFSVLSDPTVLLFLSFIILLSLGIFLSLSRGAVVAMAAAYIAVGLMQVLRNKRSWWGLVGAAVVCVLITGFVFLLPAARERLATFQDLPTEGHTRISNWMSVLQGLPEFWKFGTGLGTWPFIGPMYQNYVDTRFFDRAENQYLEALVEAGIGGLVLVFICLTAMAFAIWRMRNEEDSTTSAICVFGVFALVSQAVISITDFGLYIAANLLAFSLIAGIVFGRANSPSYSDGLDGLRYPWMARIAKGAVFAVLLLVAWPTLHHLRAASRIDMARLQMASAERVADQSPGSPAAVSALEDSIRQNEPILEELPENGIVTNQFAGLVVQHARHGLAVELANRAQSFEISIDNIWPLTSLTMLRLNIERLRTSGQDLRPKVEILDEYGLIEPLEKSRRYYQASRSNCPLFASNYFRLAQIESLLQDDVELVLEYTDRAAFLAPTDPVLRRRLGMLLVACGDQSRGYTELRESFELSLGERQNQEAILLFCLQAVPKTHLASYVLPQEPNTILDISNHFLRDPMHERTKRTLLEHALTLLPESDSATAEDHFLAGKLHAELGRNEAAIEKLAKAVEAAPKNPEWRYEYGNVLERSGFYREALQQYQACNNQNGNETKYFRALERVRTTLKHNRINLH